MQRIEERRTGPAAAEGEEEQRRQDRADERSELAEEPEAEGDTLVRDDLRRCIRTGLP